MLNVLLFNKSSQKLFIKENFLWRKIKTALWMLFCRFENLGNANPETNGEVFFLNHIEASSKIIFFDIGANVGSYTRQILLHNPQAVGHVFEPSSECFNILEKEFGSKQNIYLQNVALSSSPGDTYLYYDKEGSSWASLYKRNLSVYGLSGSMDKSQQVKKSLWKTILTNLDLHMWI